MTEVIDIKFMCSTCSRNDYYYGLVEEIAKDLGLKYTIEKITDGDKIKEQDLFIGCMFAYCPGCNALNKVRSDDSTKYVPALVINDEIILHSCVPSKVALKDILSTYIAKI